MDGKHSVTKPVSFDLALQKGKIGEDIVRKILEAKGWVVYFPFSPGAHAFDILAIKDKERCIALDVKAKARFNKYNAQGINIETYKTYKAFSERHNMPFWLLFVDEKLGSIYGNSIDALEKPCTIGPIDFPFNMPLKTGKMVRCWSLESMKTLCRLDEKQMQELKDASQRNYDYNF